MAIDGKVCIQQEGCGVMNTGLKLVCIKDAIGGSRSVGLYRFIQAIL